MNASENLDTRQYRKQGKVVISITARVNTYAISRTINGIQFSTIFQTVEPCCIKRILIAFLWNCFPSWANPWTTIRYDSRRKSFTRSSGRQTCRPVRPSRYKAPRVDYSQMTNRERLSEQFLKKEKQKLIQFLKLQNKISSCFLLSWRNYFWIVFRRPQFKKRQARKKNEYIILKPINLNAATLRQNENHHWQCWKPH